MCYQNSEERTVIEEQIINLGAVKRLIGAVTKRLSNQITDEEFKRLADEIEAEYIK